MTMNGTPTVADRIRALLPELPTAERRVARVLLANYPVAGLETVAKVAQRSGTSGPTVLRLAGRLGLAGYPELQQELRDELEARQHSPLIGYEQGGAGAHPDGEPADDSVPARAQKIFERTVSASLRRLEPSDLARAVELLTSPRHRVTVTGGRFSGLLADYLAQHLHQLRPGVSVVRTGDRVPALLDLGRRDVVVVFDVRRYQADVVDFGRRAAAAGAAVVLITDPWMSPVSTVAQVVLTAEVAAPSPFDSLVPALAVLETLVAAVVEHLGAEPRARIARYDELWADQFGRSEDPNKN